MNVAEVKKHLLTRFFLCAIFVFLLAGNASALSLNVVGPNGEAVTNFRWLIEEDATYPVTPGVLDPLPLSVRFHKSHMPAVAKGDETTIGAIQLDPAKPYFLSVLPDSGYSIGGASIKPGQGEATVRVTKQPVPTAQITIFVFEDNNPINNDPNIPAEKGLEGFTIILSEAGGRYGISGGQVTNDVFGNPLGTTYNPDGSIAILGAGIIKTDAEGKATIKNLYPGKYGIVAVPRAGEKWVQTTTIEGTRTIDAWVKANEPPYLVEFGPPGWHVFIGFIKPTYDASVLTGGATITGQVVNLHVSHPADLTFYSGGPFDHTTPWIGLNDLSLTGNKGVYAQSANGDGTFSIPNVPPGTYQLVVWDDYNDIIIAFYTVNVTQTGGIVALGEIPVNDWFNHFESFVFYDRDQDGFRDCVTPGCDDPAQDDIGISDVPVNLRFRDGTIYQSFPTDTTGYVPFDEVFPFFHWLIAEVDYTRLKATGATIVVDAGGPVLPDQGWDYPSNNTLTPQPQFEADGITPVINPNTGNNLSRTETGPVLLEAFQGFAGQTNRIEWGKGTYGPGENGGISGTVQYAITRAEDDPRLAAGEPWEPGIPRVQVNLYQDGNNDKQIDDLDGNGAVTLADVDNYPFGWSAGGAKGLEDIDRNGNGAFDLGDALQFVTTDSWDDNPPTDCQGEAFYVHGNATGCYDGLRNFNQIRPGVFDGGYAFMGIPSGIYIVEAVPPGTEYGAVYETLKEEDKNVDFGDEYSPAMLPAECVNYDENGGAGHLVPAELSLFPGVPSAFAGQYRPLCDRKQVFLSEGFNAAANFFMFTETPISARIIGLITDDVANDFDPASPGYGEKFSPAWMPVSMRDWTGVEIARTYGDEWGKYNLLVPSTYSVNVPSPSGVAPSMPTVCLNDPGPIPDPANPGQFITDPFFNKRFGQYCYTFQYMPGSTTYLDTPIVSTSAFATQNTYPLDCELPEGFPEIYSVSGPAGGPYVPNNAPLEQITITSLGMVEVPNPLYDGPGGVNPRTILRDHGFGNAPGKVMIGNTQLQITAWTSGSIAAKVPAGTSTGQLSVTRGDNKKVSRAAVTVTVGPIAGTVRSVAPGGSIQQVIDIASPGDLILVPPGVYDELVIMWKPVELQGWGPGSTVISGVLSPPEKFQAWQDKVNSLIVTGSIDLLPGQLQTTTPPFFAEPGAGITVLARNATQANGGFGQSPNARIDGFTITGADNGGAIFVNGYAHYLEISNNRLTNNRGTYGGGIRIGHPYLTLTSGQGMEYQNGYNDHAYIHNNHISENGGQGAAGGGISLYNGSDLYRVSKNTVCGNFSLGDGAGIGHLGLSNGGVIDNNMVVFNQNFNQGLAVSGGGIYISGNPGLGLDNLTPGSGSVQVLSNRIQGNLAGAGDGAGIRTDRVNGADVRNNSALPSAWYTIDIVNNFITNNIAGYAGGGISLQDTAKSNIVHNTIANNDSTATMGQAFLSNNPNQSVPQPAGIVSRAHSTQLGRAFGPGMQRYGEFSNPTLLNNIVWHNRSFYFLNDTNLFGLKPDIGAGEAPQFQDLAVLGTAVPRSLNPRYSILTDTTGYDPTNLSADPALISGYYNGGADQLISPSLTSIEVMPAFDEGGNFMDIHFGPLSLTGDYHIQPGSPAVDSGATLNQVRRDIDNEIRPNGTSSDIGADEQYQ